MILHSISKIYNHLSRDDKFRYGVIVSFIFISIIGAILDLKTRPYHSIVQCSAAGIILLTFLHYLHYKNTQFLLLTIIGSISIEFTTLLYLDNFAFYSYVIPIFIPLGIFFSVPLKSAIYLSLAHYTLLIALSIYAYAVWEVPSAFFDTKVITVFVFTGIFILVLGFFYHIALDKSYRELLVANEQKTFLLKEVHHRVKNNLNIIGSMLGLQGEESENSRIQHIFEDNRQRIEAIAVVHELLYKQDNYQSVSFVSYIDQLVIHLLPISPRNIQLQKSIEDYSFSIKSMQQFAIILNELITNSIKYAFPEHIPAPQIYLELTKVDHLYTLIYKDNGIGYKKQNFETHNTLGSEIILLACEQLKAQTTMNTTEGFKFTIRFPDDI